MKKILLSLILIFISIYSFSQANNPGCLDKTFPFFTPFDSFYLTDYCKYAESGSYEFVVNKNTQSIKKEGVYREVWFHKKEDNKKTVSGLQILQNHVDAIKAVGGDVVKESDGSVFRTTYNGKELWIYVNANTNSMDLDNYGIISIEVNDIKQEINAQGTTGLTGVTSPQGAQGSTAGCPVHTIGELYGGGIVVAFWKESGVEKGLIASLTDISTGAAWSNRSSSELASAESLFDGQANTNAIIAQPGHTASAAKLCDDYTAGGFSDWYLPAAWELNQCYNAAFIINTILGATNGFAFPSGRNSMSYWSSSVTSLTGAMSQNFNTGLSSYEDRTRLFRVRAVRRY